MLKMRSSAASTFSIPSVLSVAIIWRFIFDGETLSLSIRSMLPIPALARASTTYPPTPPMPKTATRASDSFLTPSSPMSMAVLTFLSSIKIP